MKHIAFLTLALASFSAFSSPDCLIASDKDQVDSSTANLVSEVINEYNLVPAAPGEESMSVTIQLEAQKVGDPPKGGIFSGGDISPVIGFSIGSAKIGTVNLLAGFESKYIAGDFTIGTGSVMQENTVADDGNNQSGTISTGQYYTGSVALRARILEYFEVGLRYMDQSYGTSSPMKSSYLSSLKSLGYDVKLSFPIPVDETIKGLSGTITLSGLKKDSSAPNFIQVGLKYRILE